MNPLVFLASWINQKTSSYLIKKWGVNKELNRSLRLRKIKRGDVRVSDHAVMRYFERMEGYDIENVYNLIGKDVKKTDGISKQTIGDMTVVVDGGVVVTLYKSDSKTGNMIKGFDKL